jgi:hypothetical protein
MYKLSKGQGDSAAISLINDNVDSNNGVAESDVDSQVTASDAPIKDAAAGVATGDNTEEMFETFPNGRVFKVFSCFVLYGPCAPEAQQSVLFQQNDFLRPNEDKKSAGRNASCKEELEQKNKECEASTSGARGTTISARTDVVFAVQQDAAEQQRDYENKEPNRRRMKVSRIIRNDFVFQGMYLSHIWEDRLSSPRLLKPCQDTMRVLSLLETSVAKTHMNDSLPTCI